MPGTEFFHDDCYKGMGISEGLARGLQVKMEGIDLTQEGMGLGAIAVRSHGNTYFSRDSRIVEPDPHSKFQDYVIDTIQLLGRGGRADPWITRMSELLTALYRALPVIQNGMLWTDSRIRGFLGITSHFAPVPLQARARFHFRLHPDQIEVSCEFHALADAPQQLFIMNELGADFFTSSWRAGHPAAPPSGWQVLSEPQNLPFLYSPQTGLRFSLRNITVDNNLPFKVCWGREHGRDLRWAGFAIQIEPAAASIADLSCHYTIIFENDHA